MKRILVAYASKHGSTRDVAVSIAGRLHAVGHDVELLPASGVSSIDRYDGVVLGGALYMGRLRKDARVFLEDHRVQLAHTPLAIFALGPRTLSPADVAASRAQLDAALAPLVVAPALVTVFGGAVDPTKLHFPFSRMQATDARDWHAIVAWADDVGKSFRRARADGAETVIWGLQPRRELSRSRG